MINFDLYKCEPFGSILTRPIDEQATLLEMVFSLPTNTRMMVTSPKTSAYVRGLARAHQLSINQAWQMAFDILIVTLGIKSLAQLPSLLSTDLQLSNEKAQALAKEIEQDLFTPIILELNNYLSRIKSQRAQKAEQIARQAGARNVLNLKSQTNIPQPPAIPY